MKVEAFKKYIVEREQVRKLKEMGRPWPWTQDPILQKYKFTNVHRKNDRTTKKLLELYTKWAPKSSMEVTLLHCGIFRYTGRWEFAHDLGWIKQPSKDTFRRIATLARARNMKDLPVWTGAYTITNKGSEEPKEIVVSRMLNCLWFSSDLIIKELNATRSWEKMYYALRKVDGFGGTGFMAKEVLQDFLLCYPDCADDAVTWSPVGPGARRGINRVLGRDTDFNQPEPKWLLELPTVRAAVNKELIGTGIKPLTAHDVQFCLCEFDKYERVRKGEGKMRAQYKPEAQR